MTRIAVLSVLLSFMATSDFYASAFSVLQPRGSKTQRPLRSTQNSDASETTKSPPSTSSDSEGKSARWTESSRWESQETARPSSTGEQYILKEQFGTYFKVPNPATLMTKIICTIGPASSSPQVLGKMMDAGMAAARINMSHNPPGEYAKVSEMIDTIRQVAKSRNKLCPIVLDTKGPEIRVKQLTLQKTKMSGDAETKPETSTMPVVQMNLESGEGIVLLTGQHSDHDHTEAEISATQNFLTAPPPVHIPMDTSETPKVSSTPAEVKIIKEVTVTYHNLAGAVRQGDVILLDDGRISLIVTKVPNQDEVHCQVIMGGLLKQNKGVNLPGCQVDLPHITDKDEEDILFGVTKQVEFIAHSFTRSATGINQVRELPGVVESGCHIIAKIESQEGLDNFESILRVCDGVMVARGDLGVEIPLERVSSVQKRLVASSNAVGKPVIVATELLDSMINSPRPTRAEASDVANAVFDGADCVMLSGESAVGKYPVESIQVMSRICKEAEIDLSNSLRSMAAMNGKSNNISKNNDDRGAVRDSFAKSAIRTAQETKSDLIMAITRTGLTANALAKFFSTVPVMVISTSKPVCAQILLHRSVTPYHVQSLDRLSCLPRAVAKAIELGLVEPGSRVLLLTGPDDMIANRLETFVVGETIVSPPMLSTETFAAAATATPSDGEKEQEDSEDAMHSG